MKLIIKKALKYKVKDRTEITEYIREYRKPEPFFKFYGNPEPPTAEELGARDCLTFNTDLSGWDKTKFKKADTSLFEEPKKQSLIMRIRNWLNT